MPRPRLRYIAIMAALVFGGYLTGDYLDWWQEQSAPEHIRTCVFLYGDSDPSLEQAAMHDIVVINAAKWFDLPKWREGIAEIRSHNVGCLLLAQVPAWRIPGWYIDKPPGTFKGDWHTRLEQYWTGDVDPFSGAPSPIIDITDPACRWEMISILLDHWIWPDPETAPGGLDGIFLDFLWMTPTVQGIDKASQLALLAELDAAFSGIVIICNGRGAREWPQTWEYQDGVCIEDIPEHGYPGRFETFFDPDCPWSLYQLDRRGMVIIDRRWHESSYPTHVLAQFGDRSYGSHGRVWYEPGELEYLDLGAPLGPMLRVGDIVSREFEQGTRVIRITETWFELIQEIPEFITWRWTPPTNGAPVAHYRFYCDPPDEPAVFVDTTMGESYTWYEYPTNQPFRVSVSGVDSFGREGEMSEPSDTVFVEAR